MVMINFSVVLVSLSIFGLPVEDVPHSDNYAYRVQILAVVVLTVVSFKLQVAERLPDLSYMTFLDKYMLTSIGLLLLLVAEAVVVFNFRNVQLANYVDTLVGLLFASAWIFGHVPLLRPLLLSMLGLCLIRFSCYFCLVCWGFV